MQTRELEGSGARGIHALGLWNIPLTPQRAMQPQAWQFISRQQVHRRQEGGQAPPLLCPQALGGGGGGESSLEESLGEVAQTITNLFPLWVVMAGGLALIEPTLFTW